MKKVSLFVALASAFLMASCIKENSGNINEPETIIPVEPYTITVTIPQDMTKVSFTQENKGAQTGDVVKLGWESDDEIVVADNGNASVSRVFIVETISEDKKTATFALKEGQETMFTPSNDKFDILYGAASIAEAEAEDLSSQTQNGNASANLTDLKYMALLSGVNTTDDIKFSPVWAEEHGNGTFKETGIIRLWLQVPDGVESVLSVSLNAPSAIFYKSNALNENEKVSSLKLSFIGNATPDSGDHNTVTGYLTLPWKDVTVAAETSLSVTIDTPSCLYTRDFSPNTSVTFSTGAMNAVKLNKSNYEEEGYFAGGKGIEGDPWLIATPEHMQNIAGRLVEGETKYFKMMDDVDMVGVTWTPLTVVAPYLAIDFDGDHKTISNLTSTGKYASFAGVLNGAVYNVTFDNASITSTQGKSGVVAGFLGSNAGGVSADCHGVTVKNSMISSTSNYVGGIAGTAEALSSKLDDCHVINTTVEGNQTTNTDVRAGGLLGQLGSDLSVSNCTAEDVTVNASKNVGGLIGVAYGRVERCSSSGSVSSPNTTSNADIALGGLVGYFENGVITQCSSSVTINQSTNGRDIGGLIGKMLAGKVEKSFATGNVTGIQRNVGGFVGLITLTSNTATITDCYSTGDVSGNSYTGGFVGLHEKGNATISNCYSTSKTQTTSFAAGGLIGIIGSADFTMQNCAAWNSAVTPGSYGSANWSSGAVVAVTFPSCTLTGNYRKPGNWLTAYWIPGDYDHPDVSISNKLVIRVGDSEPYTYKETTATATGSGNEGYPQFPYHGHFTSETDLSQLASTTLGWPSEIWDFTGDLPILK